jgi:dinuclear metal center YbgI/SA1388 family protein
MARRDEIVAYANELLQLDAWPDFGPMGMQVVGAEEVTRIACGVSASRALFEQAAASGAQLVLVHHGILLFKGPQTIDARQKGRLQALFDADLTLAAYHLALDAHPEIGNNACLARELGVEPEGPFAQVGVGGRLRDPCSVAEFVERVRELLGSDPLVFAEGPARVERVAISSGKAGHDLVEAATEGYDLFLTGEPEEGTLHTALELGVHFVAAGHYATERLGIQALATRLAEHFGLEWEFIELPNPV